MPRKRKGLYVDLPPLPGFPKRRPPSRKCKYSTAGSKKMVQIELPFSGPYEVNQDDAPPMQDSDRNELVSILLMKTSGGMSVSIGLEPGCLSPTRPPTRKHITPTIDGASVVCNGAVVQETERAILVFDRDTRKQGWFPRSMIVWGEFGDLKPEAVIGDYGTVRVNAWFYKKVQESFHE